MGWMDGVSDRTEIGSMDGSIIEECLKRIVRREEREREREREQKR